jgi:N utilization substance protein A
MDIDLAALRMLEREKEIPLSVLIPAIEQSLLVAYQHTGSASSSARVELDRKTGHVTVWATEELEDGTTREFDDTPAGFGRIAATTARQVIFQRLRDADDDRVLGEFAGREGDIVGGIIQQGPDARNVLVNLGAVEGVLPTTEQVPR